MFVQDTKVSQGEFVFVILLLQQSMVPRRFSHPQKANGQSKAQQAYSQFVC